MAQRWLVGLLASAALMLGCDGDKDERAAAPAGGATAGASEKKPSGPSYALTVQPPAAGKVGEELSATVRVVPKGPYKVNLEYPLKLAYSGPGAARPAKATLTAKQATKVDKSVILFEPKFKLTAAGDHTFAGKLKFSVCTKRQCEIKAEKVTWVARVAP